MQLTPAECKRFYDVWLPLLVYVNRRLKVVEHLDDVASFPSLPTEAIHKVRDALWADDSLLDDFVAENPAGLSAEDLALAAGWHTRKAGRFFIFRYLKKYTVFLDDSSPVRAYGVLALNSTFQDLVGPYLPVMVETVLLPFENRIIYDSLFLPYRISFGPGIRANLKDDFNNAKEREGIITQLGAVPAPGSAEARKQVAAANARVLREFEKHLYKSGLSPKTVPRHVEVLNLFNAFLAERSPGRTLREVEQADLREFLEGWLPGQSPTHKADTSLRRFVRFMRDSGRMDWVAAQDILEFL